MNREAEEELLRLCKTEAEAHEWQLRCLQAETEVRLLKHRGGEAAALQISPRRRASQNQQLLEDEASSYESKGVSHLRQIVEARFSREVLSQQLLHTKEIARKARQFSTEEEVKLHDLSELHRREETEVLEFENKLLAEHQTLELKHKATQVSEGVLEQSEIALAAHEEKARQLGEEFNAEQKESQRLQMDVEDEWPRLERLQQNLAKSAEEADRARRAAQRRAEEVSELEEERVAESQEDEQMQRHEEEQLEICRSELVEASEANDAEEAQIKEMKKQHVRQLNAIKKSNKEVQEAYDSAAQEHALIEDRLRSAIMAKGELASSTETYADAAAGAHTQVEALRGEVTVLHTGLKVEEEHRAREEQEWALSERALNDAASQRKELEAQVSCTAAELGDADQALDWARLDLSDARSKFADAEASWPGAEDSVRLHDESGQLREQGEQLQEEHSVLRREAELQRKHREEYLAKRKEGLQHVAQLKVYCGEVLRDLRGRGKGAVKAEAGGAGVEKGVTEVAEKLDALLQFLEVVVVAAGTNPAEPSGLELLESTTASRIQEERERQNELLDQEKQKVLAQRRSLQEATQSHASEAEEVWNAREEAAQDLCRCEDEFRMAQDHARLNIVALQEELTSLRAHSQSTQEEASQEIEGFLRQRRTHFRDLKRVEVELQDEVERLKLMGPAGFVVPINVRALYHRLEHREVERDELRESLARLDSGCKDIAGELLAIRLEHEEEYAAFEELEKTSQLEEMEAARMQMDCRSLRLPGDNPSKNDKALEVSEDPPTNRAPRDESDQKDVLTSNGVEAEDSAWQRTAHGASSSTVHEGKSNVQNPATMSVPQSIPSSRSMPTLQPLQPQQPVSPRLSASPLSPRVNAVKPSASHVRLQGQPPPQVPVVHWSPTRGRPYSMVPAVGQVPPRLVTMGPGAGLPRSTHSWSALPPAPATVVGNHPGMHAQPWQGSRLASAGSVTQAPKRRSL